MRAIQSDVSRAGCRPVPVAIYTRVSTINQVGGRFDSCESQASICREFLRKHADEGWYEAASFSDPAYSGGSMNRPGFQALKRQIEAGDIKVVLIFKLERVLRSTDEWTPLRAFLQKHGCRLVSPSEDLSDDTASGRLKNNLLVSVAEYERLNTAEKVRAKMLEQAKRGIWNTGQVPFGYDYNTDTQTLHPNPKETILVRRIFEQTAQLVSLTEIANSLNDEGHRTRVRIFKRRDGTRQNVGGKRFRSDLLRKIVRNPIYLGRVRLHGEEFAAKHTPLVTADLWERANAAVAKLLQPARSRLQQRDTNSHLLKGLALCGHCARALVPNASGKLGPDGKPYRYYTCGYTHKERDDSSCPVRHISADWLESTVVAYIGAVGRHPEVITEAIASSDLRCKGDRGSLRAQIADLDQALAKVNRRLHNCVEAIAAGGAEVLGDELRERASALRTEKQGLLVERERATQELLICEQDMIDVERITQAVGRFNEVLAKLAPEEQKDLVALCVDRVEVRVENSSSRRGASDGRRQLALRIKLHAARLVEGLEERVVVEHRRQARPIAVAKRMLTLDSRVAMGHPAEVLSPFREELGARRRPAPKTAVPEPVVAPNPMRRAVAWQRQLDRNPNLSRAQLARDSGASGPTMTRHLDLLKLTPEIQAFLLSLKTASELRKFSLNKMSALAHLKPDEQQRCIEMLKTKK